MSVLRDDATEAQVRAADPGSSTWLAANAGSGKTRVLTDRVARLLLQGVDPQQVLCLTYTKAAASEMQNRLFQRLGAWAMLEDDPLRAALLELGEDEQIEASSLSLARTLFARAIETPGGLKIQTIHSFCAGLLRRFPLEAGVNPQFQEMEDRSAELLRAEIVDDMATGSDTAVLNDLAFAFTGESIDSLTRDILNNRELFGAQKDLADISTRFGVAADFDDHDVIASLFDGREAALFERVLPIFVSGTVTDQKVASALASVKTFDASAIPALEKAFLTVAKQPKKTIATKKTAETLGAALSEIADLVDRLMDTRDKIMRSNAARRTFILNSFAVPFLHHYETAKRLRGWLDFDDLILRTRALLSDQKVADWVLYRLDGGISHVLVDEAQDTSPAQWDVIRKLTQEFTSGLGAREDMARTLFVVGDKKQSIYSFQGADPSAFDDMEAEFRDKFQAVDAPFQSRSLDFSFRSSDAILKLVDTTFDGLADAGFNGDQMHRAFHGQLPGRVDVWPVVEPVSSDEDRHWTDPIDRKSETHHSVLLARQVADQIEDMLKSGTLPDKGNRDATFKLRPVEAGDIMILVQRRSALFHEIIRACKQRELPIAGADRLRVGAELAVRDLLALLSFLATPEDSLSLAACLRSPLFGWSEKDLFQLANGRPETHLWQALRKATDHHASTLHILHDLRGQIDFLRPYDLLERILTRHNGRKRLLARLGVEAQDGIDALLSQALAYERNAIPSLTGFLTWARADDLEIKRQADSSGNLIRVMTVHGSKGLEAPVVFLPDCGQRKLTIRDEILRDDEMAVWKTKADATPTNVATLIDAEKAKQEQERLRLLYVAMTRAEKWLIVGAAGTLSKDGSDWYQRIEQAMRDVGAVPHDFSGGTGLRYEFESWALDTSSHVLEASKSDVTMFDWMTQPLLKMPDRLDPVSPSNLGGSKALPSVQGLPEDIALARGTYVHHLLEHLVDAPKDQWLDHVTQIPCPSDLTDAALINAAQQEALAVLRSPNLEWIFADDALAEVSIHGDVGGTPMLGIIDRLVVGSEKIIVVDFKTNVEVPSTPEACPEGILRQMGAYVAMLEQIYPGKKIETGILWTTDASFMSLPHGTVMEAVMRSPRLDVGHPAS
ncbi:MAG: double-strand break repair helicase AddA [Aliishimia sp.]